MIILRFREKEMPDGEGKKQCSSWKYYNNREIQEELYKKMFFNYFFYLFQAFCRMNLLQKNEL